MKRVWIVLGLLAVLVSVGVGVACGPEQKYCFIQHETCTQAEIDREQAIKDMMNRADSGTGLGEMAVVIEAGM
jgi:hypothetical protein